MTKVFLNGDIIDQNKAKISVFDRGFIFGDGVYEVVRIVNSQLIDNDYHLKRLERSLNSIYIKIKYSLEQIEELMNKLIEANQLVDGMIYLQITRGQAMRQFEFCNINLEANIFMFTNEIPLIDCRNNLLGASAYTYPDIRWQKREIKSTSLLAQVLAKDQAKSKGGYEALMIDNDGYLTEGSSSSLFIVDRENKIRTRPTDGSILIGVTRRAILEVASKLQLEVSEERYKIDELMQAREVFLTSTLSFVQPIVKIDDINIADGKVGEVARSLYSSYFDAVSKMAGR